MDGKEMEKDKTDQKIVANYIAGQNDSFKVIVDRYLKHVYNYCCQLVGNREEVEDLTAEVFLKVIKNIKKYSPELSFKTWVFSIARNTCIDWLRKKKHAVFSEMGDEDSDYSFEESIPDREILPDEVFLKKEEGAKLGVAVSKLRANYRDVIILHYTEGLSFNEISLILKKPLNTVRSLHRRALVKLKDLLLHQNL